MAPDLTAATVTTTPVGPSETQAEEASAAVQAATSVTSLSAADTQTLPATNVMPTMVVASNSPATNTEAPSPSFATITQQTPQANTGPSVISTRRQRIRKALDLQLNACTCGVTITDTEIQEGKNVMQCHAPGCETVWVSAYFPPLFAPNVSDQGTLLSFIRNA